MKKQNIEKILISLIFILLGFAALFGIKDSLALIYNLISFSIYPASFVYLGIYWIGNPSPNRGATSYWSGFILLILVGWFFTTLSYGLYMAKLSDTIFRWRYLFHPIYIKEFLETFLPACLLGLVYGYFRKMRLLGKWAQIKRAILFASVVIGILVIGGFGYYFYRMDLGDQVGVNLIDPNQELTSLEEVLSQKELQGKPVYVDLWFSTCGPCISSFQKMGPGKKYLEENGYAILYLAREISLPDSKARWMESIKKYDLKGNHVYMSKELEQDIASYIKDKLSQNLAYPHFLLVDSTGTVINWNAPRVEDLDGLKKLISVAN